MNHVKARVFAAMIVAAFTLVTAQAAFTQSQENWKQVCQQALAQPFAPPVLADKQPESELQNCDAEALYYGFDKEPDPIAAAECAYYQRDHPEPTRGDPFYGPGVLTMLYANGKGVPRNYDLAIRFACENPWAADTEMEFRIGHLERLRETHASTSNFDLCDEVTSGLMQGACESVQQQFADAKRRQELQAISSSWSPEITNAFGSLQSAEKAFEEARVANEVDLSGTGRAAFQLQEQGRLRDQFLINLKRFTKADIPSVSAANARDVDRELNAVYQQIQRSPPALWEYSTIKPSGVRDTERAWLELRDAWVEFGRQAYPTLDATRITVQLTRLRLHQLRSLVGK